MPDVQEDQIGSFVATWINDNAKVADRLNYDEVINALDGFKRTDFSEFGVNQEEVIRVINRVISDLQSQGSDFSEDFVMTYSNQVRLLMSCVLIPELYGTNWGWIESEAIDNDVWAEQVTAHINSYFSEKIRQITAQEIKSRGQNAIDYINSEKVEEGERQALIRNGVVSFLEVNALTSIENLITIVENPAANNINSVYPNLNTKFAAGKLKEIKRKLINAGKSEVVLETETSVRDALIAAIVDAPNYETIRSAVEKVIDANDIGIFMSSIPNKFKARNKRFSYMNDEAIIEKIYRALMIQEGRYVGPEYFPSNFFADYNHSPFIRYVPKTPEDGSYAIPEDEFEASGKDPESYFKMEDHLLLYNLSKREIEEINRRINTAIESGEEFIIFVPTCPCDRHTLVDENSIRFIGGPIIGEIAWPALNNIDAVTVLAKHLESIGVKARIIFGTGDMEHDSGNTRSMTYEDFMDALNQSHGKIVNLVSSRLGIDMESNYVGVEGEELKAFDVETDGAFNLQVAGITQIVGGIDVFKQHKECWRERIDIFWEDKANEAIIGKVITARSRYYNMVVANNCPEIIDEAEKLEKKKEFLKKDILDYVTFHSIISEHYGNHRMIIVAGDSHPLEELASRIVGTCLVPVHGNYDGSKFLS